MKIKNSSLNIKRELMESDIEIHRKFIEVRMAEAQDHLRKAFIYSEKIGRLKEKLGK